ncbi:MAG: AraC family transcriptional regulator [Chloroflexota bacterium]
MSVITMLSDHTSLPLPPPFFPDDVGVGQVVYPPGGTLGPRTQDNIQLVFLHRGTMMVVIDGHEQINARSGTVTLLLPPHHEFFKFTPDASTDHSWLHLHCMQPPQSLIPYMQTLPKTIRLSTEMNALITRALRLQQSNLSTAALMMKAMALQMVWLYIGEAQQTGQKGSLQQNDLIEAALQYIQDHLSEDMRLKDIAAAVSVSENHLIRLFKQHVGTTPINYLWQRRINHAIDLLQRTGLSIGQIAQASGFKTSYHFSRRIRKSTGHTPTEIRNRSW